MKHDYRDNTLHIAVRGLKARLDEVEKNIRQQAEELRTKWEAEVKLLEEENALLKQRIIELEAQLDAMKGSNV